MENANKRNNKITYRVQNVNDRTLYHYIDRLTELSIAMFDWKNVPPEIDIRFLEVALFSQGSCLFFYDEALEEYLVTKFNPVGPMDIYKHPIKRRAYTDNGASYNLDNKDSVIIYNNMIRTPAQIDIELFARKLANLDRVIDVNTNAQKTPILIQADDERKRLTMMNLYEKYDGNHPYIFAYKGFADSVKVFKTDAPYVADDIYTLKTQIWNEALTYLGISNINITKKERLITDEVTRNQGGTIASRYSRLESRREACKKINDMFGLDMWVDYREDYQSTELVASDTVMGDPNSDGIDGVEVNPIEKISTNLETKEETKDDTDKKNGIMEAFIQWLKGGK